MRAVGLRQMVVQRADFAGEQFRLVSALAARAVVLSQKENFVHTHMEGIGAGDLGEFIDQVEDHAVQLRVQGAVAAAIDALVVGIFAGSLVELGMPAQQSERGFRPRLVAQQIDHGDEAHAGVARCRGEALQVVGRERVGIHHFRMFGELVPVVDLQHQQVHALFGQGLFDEALGQRDLIGLGSREMNSADRKRLRGSGRRAQEGERYAEHGGTGLPACPSDM